MLSLMGAFEEHRYIIMVSCIIVRVGRAQSALKTVHTASAHAKYGTTAAVPAVIFRGAIRTL